MLDEYDEDDFLKFVAISKAKLAYPDLKAAGLPAQCAAVQALAPAVNPWYIDMYRLYEEQRIDLGLVHI